MTNIEMVAAELEAAKKKHPKFVDYFTFTTCKTFEPELRGRRSKLEVSKLQGNVMFHDILECEMFEALDAYVHGDLAHARQELAQCAAVCVRAMEHIEHEMENKTK
jgi:hypothetical protein